MSSNEEDSKQKYAAVQSAPEVIHEAVVIENVAPTAEDKFIAPTQTSEEQHIPDHFLRVGPCLACSCANTAMPGCLGGKYSQTVLCLEDSGIWCKPLEDPKTCCIWNAGESLCVYPRMCCKSYQQCFCFECFFAIPNVDEGYKNTPIAKVNMPSRDGTGVRTDSVICNGYCCYTESCFCKCPECLGCYFMGSTFYGLEWEAIYSKFMCWDETKENKDLLCIFWKGNRTCVWPYTCYKEVFQCLCLDRRCAVPCDDEVPCVFTPIMCCTCCVNFEINIGCCTTIGQALVNSPTYQQRQQAAQQQQAYNNPAKAQPHPVTTMQPV